MRKAKRLRKGASVGRKGVRERRQDEDKTKQDETRAHDTRQDEARRDEECAISRVMLHDLTCELDSRKVEET